MKLLLKLVMVTLIMTSVAHAQSYSEFETPWKDPNASIIIDCYDGNDLDFEKMKTDPHFAGLIHKVTEGINTIDDKYEERKKLAEKHRMLFGAYHLGRSGDPIEQADFFIKQVGQGNDILLVLNLEQADNNIMSLDNAAKFISHVHEKTGKYPAVMVNNVILEKIINNYDQTSVFDNCLLIYERLLDKLPTKELKNKIWDRYFLWQFCTNLNCKQGQNCKYSVPGTLYNIDVNVFAHDRKVLEYIWMANQYNDNLSYKVKDMTGYFKGPIYCAEGKEVTNIKYVEVSDKNTGEMIDRYLSYDVDGKMLVTRDVFRYAADKMDVYELRDFKTIKSPNKQLAKLSVAVDDASQNFMISYETMAEPDAKSADQIKEKVGDMVKNASSPYFTSVQLTEIKFDCE